MLRKVEFFLSMIDYHVILVNNKYIMYQMSNKFMNSKGFIQAIKPDVLTENLSKMNFSDNLMKSAILLIHDYMLNLFNSKVRLQIRKNKLQNRYNEVIKIGIKLAEDINYDGIVKSRVKKLLQDAENIKELENLEKEKFDLQSEINDIIQLNRQYVLFKNPVDIFINLKIIKFTKKEIKGKNKKILILTDKYKHLDKILKKKIIEIGIYYKKLERFNTSSSLKPFNELISTDPSV